MTTFAVSHDCGNCQSHAWNTNIEQYRWLAAKDGKRCLNPTSAAGFEICLDLKPTSLYVYYIYHLNIFKLAKTRINCGYA